MDKINANKLGLIVGFFLALVHLVWALTVAITPISLQKFLDWIFKLHFLEPILKLTAFNIMNAIWLVILTFVIGYILGWVLALIHNCVSKKCK